MVEPQRDSFRVASSTASVDVAQRSLYREVLTKPGGVYCECSV